MLVLSIILFCVAAVCWLISYRHFHEKGFVFNNAWLYATEEEREKMDKSPYYRQSAVVFLLLGLQFVMLGVFCLTKHYFFIIAQSVVMAAVVIYAIVSAIRIEKKKN